jgi:hypothetical protein
MAAAVSSEKIPNGGTVVQGLAATSGLVANAVASVQLSGTTSSHLAGLTQMIVTSSGATAAAAVTLALTGIATAQIAGAAINMVFGCPAGAGVPADPLIVTFDPPLVPAAGGTIKAELSALGAGHVRASVVLLGKLMPI